MVQPTLITNESIETLQMIEVSNKHMLHFTLKFINDGLYIWEIVSNVKTTSPRYRLISSFNSK